MAACTSSRDAAIRDTIVSELVLPDSARRARDDSLAKIQRDSVAGARSDSLLRASPGYVVDSAVSPEVALDRFRAGSPRLATLEGGAPSRDSLVALVVHAAQTHDQRALTRVAISRAEYAWLIYPALPLSRPPYRQPPDVSWMLQDSESRTGMSRLLDHLRDGATRVRGYACAEPPERYASVRAWPHCTVQVDEPLGTRRSLRLFGAIVRVEGQFKILSFANDF